MARPTTWATRSPRIRCTSTTSTPPGPARPPSANQPNRAQRSWTPASATLQAQGQNSSHGNFIFIGTKGSDVKFDSKALKTARKKVGEWNTTEVISKDGELTAKVNDAEVASGKGELMEGTLGLQSEGAEIHFRNIKIMELPPGVTSPEQAAPEFK